MSDEMICPPSRKFDGTAGPLSFSVEIRGGRTGFRRRPILGDRFLIGSDPVCDLRVDDRIAAPMHCLLRRDGDHLEVERLTDASILVNGTPVDHAEVGDGETIAIGPVRLVVHAHAMRFDVVRPTDERMEMPDLPGRTASQLARTSGRSAAEVVDLLEVEQDRVREFDERRKAGASALLGVLRQTKRPATEAVAAAPSITADALLTKVGRLATTIEHQTARRIRDEHDLRKAADELLAAQRELLGQADRLFRLASALAEADRSHRRAG